MNSDEFKGSDYARSITDNAVLWIKRDSSWNLSLPGVSTKDSKPITFGSYKTIDDVTFGVNSITVASDTLGVYELFVVDSNENYYDATLNSAAQVVNVKTVSISDVLKFETRFNVDINENNIIGDVTIVDNDAGNTEVLESGDSLLSLLDDFGSSTTPTKLKVGGSDLSQKSIDQLGYSIVAANSGSTGYDLFVKDKVNNVVLNASFDAKGNLSTVQPLSADQITSVSAKLNFDISGASSLPTNSTWLSGIKNDYIRTELSTQLASSKFVSMAGFTSLIDKVISYEKSNGGKVDANTFADLKLIANHGAGLFGSSIALDGSTNNYLVNVVNNMILGCSGNAFYTGGQLKSTVLGNLAAGSTVSVLQKLENKWLLGNDMPSPISEGDSANPNAAPQTGVYKAVAGQVLTTTPQILDISQGNIGDCYFLASLQLMTYYSPGSLKNMVVNNGVIDGVQSWGIRFYDQYGTANWVTVNNQLPYVSPTVPFLGSTKVKGDIWVPIFEKAYTQANADFITYDRGPQAGIATYAAIEGGFATPLQQMLNYPTLWLTNSDAKYFAPIKTKNFNTSNPVDVQNCINQVTQAIDSGRMVWIGSSNDTYDKADLLQDFVDGHALIAVNAEPKNPTSTSVLIFNPWGAGNTDSNYLAGNTFPYWESPFKTDVASLVAASNLDIWIV
jgi:hypothetical protein